MKKLYLQTFAGILLLSLFILSCHHREKNSTPTPMTLHDSIAQVSKEIVKDSSDYKLWLQRAKLYLEQGALDPCLRDIGKTLELNGKDPEIFYVLSDAYFILGNIKESKDALKKAIDLEPKRELSYVKLSRLSLILKDYPSAVKYADKALSLNPDDARAFFIKALVNVEQGDTSQSIQNLKAAINLDSSYFEANMQLGTILSLRNDSNAMRFFKQALTIRSGNHAAMYGLGLAYQNSGYIDSALMIYDSILAINKNEPQVYFNKGYIYLLEKSDFSKAEQSFKKAVMLDTTFVEAVYNLGRTYEAENKKEQALFYYRKALKLVPNYPLAIAGINRIEK